MKKFYYVDNFFSIALISLLSYFSFTLADNHSAVVVLLMLFLSIGNFLYFNFKFKVINKIQKKVDLSIGVGFEFVVCIFIKISIMVVLLCAILNPNIDIMIYPLILGLFCLWVFENYLAKNAYICNNYLVSIEKGPILLSDIKGFKVLLNNVKNFDYMDLEIKTKDDEHFECYLGYNDFKIIESLNS